MKSCWKCIMLNKRQFIRSIKPIYLSIPIYQSKSIKCNRHGLAMLPTRFIQLLVRDLMPDLKQNTVIEWFFKGQWITALMTQVCTKSLFAGPIAIAEQVIMVDSQIMLSHIYKSQDSNPKVKNLMQWGWFYSVLQNLPRISREHCRWKFTLQ